jgi:hypothetical protein
VGLFKVIHSALETLFCEFINTSIESQVKLFSARKSLVSDISAGEGKTASLFYSVYCKFYFYVRCCKL